MGGTPAMYLKCDGCGKELDLETRERGWFIDSIKKTGWATVGVGDYRDKHFCVQCQQPKITFD